LSTVRVRIAESRANLEKIDTARWWRSPLRGPWLTSVFGAALLVGIPIEFITGLISYAAYNPRLGGNNPNSHVGALNFYLFSWGGGPSWLYRLTQGVHVGLGLALVPIVLAKLWSVIPRLFVIPPFRTIAQLLERLSLILLVGGIVFELVTGIMNIDYDYSFRFSFYDGHFLGAWMFIAGFVTHVAIKMPKMISSLRSRSLRTELRTPVSATEPEASDGEDSLVAPEPAPATMSRRGALGLVGAGSAAVVILTAGQAIGGPTRNAALLAPRGRSYGSGPTDFQINKTAASAGIRPSQTGGDWRLTLQGDRTVILTRQDLLSMPLATHQLPIACVEGWSTVQSWTGVRLGLLATLVGVVRPTSAVVESIERNSPYSRITLTEQQVRSAQALLALMVNGVDLSPDHGYPARTLIPAAPGVHNTKWVNRIIFRGSPG
jgi:DMSO/TMAO reductase YedYZ molybdopterin-dependent catalytic subunit